MTKNKANFVCLLVAAIWGGGFIATDAALSTCLLYTSPSPRDH